MATLSVQNPSAGTAITMTSASASDQFSNNGKVALMVVSTDAGSCTITFDSPGTCNFGAAANAAHDLAVTVAAGATKVIGPLDPARFNDGSDMCIFTSSVTGATIKLAALRIV